MGRYKLPDEKKAEIAKMINAESKRLARMIQTFLDVERLSAGQMELRREPFAAADVVAACVERVKPLAERKQIQVESEALPEADILGDKELLEYAVYNLMTNAVKYSPGGTQVKVWGEHSGDQFRISVRDQGIGMDEKELKSIFRKFYRTKKAELSGETGTGIGLSIVEQIVIHHGGKMEVTSSPGAGSCFTMVLPASHRHENGT
jgi:signal transduction histidine kinase